MVGITVQMISSGNVLLHFLGLGVAFPAVAEHEVEHDPRVQGQERHRDAQDEEERLVRGIGHVRPAGYHGITFSS